MEKRRKCPRGHYVVKEIDPQLKDKYPYYCPECDENMYEFETKEENGRKRTLP